MSDDLIRELRARLIAAESRAEALEDASVIERDRADDAARASVAWQLRAEALAGALVTLRTVSNRVASAVSSTGGFVIGGPDGDALRFLLRQDAALASAPQPTQPVPAAPQPRIVNADSPEWAIAALGTLRAAGWLVAVHNDYRQDGRPQTFWLLTHPTGKWIKGEGHSDAFALAECVAAAWRFGLLPAEPVPQPAPAREPLPEMKITSFGPAPYPAREATWPNAVCVCGHIRYRHVADDLSDADEVERLRGVEPQPAPAREAIPTAPFSPCAGYRSGVQCVECERRDPAKHAREAGTEPRFPRLTKEKIAEVMAHCADDSAEIEAALNEVFSPPGDGLVLDSARAPASRPQGGK